MLTRLVTTTILAGGLAAIGAAGAAAADLDRIIYAPELDRTVPVEIGNGWYLRGDIGYAVETEGGADGFDAFGVQGGFDNSRIDSELSGSLGAGYQFNEWLRGDLTFDYSKGELEGGTAAGDLCGGIGPCGFGADFDAYGLLANGYVDLGTYVGFTPYVGGGVGYTYLDWDPARITNGLGASADFGSDGDWRFTYALMAGVSYDLSKSLKVDLGYRYLDVDGGETFSDGGVSGDDEGFTKHEVRAGLRYSLW